MIHLANVMKKLKMQCISFLNAKDMIYKELSCLMQQGTFIPLSINILLFGNPDLSAQDNQIIFDAVHSFIKSSRRFFNIDVFVVIVFFVVFLCVFFPHILFATALLTFRFRNFVLGVGSRQTKDLLDFLSYFFFFRLLYFFCNSVWMLL